MSMGNYFVYIELEGMPTVSSTIPWACVCGIYNKAKEAQFLSDQVSNIALWFLLEVPA